MYLNTCITITCISITPILLIIIKYCCGKQCELLLNRFIIKDLHHILNLLRHLPLSSIIYDKIRPPPLFQLPCGTNFDPLPLLSTPPLTKILDPHLYFDDHWESQSFSIGLNEETVFGFLRVSDSLTDFTEERFSTGFYEQAARVRSE